MVFCECKQDFFYIEKGGEGKFAQMDGLFAVFLHEEEGYLIAFAGRLPSVVGNALFQGHPEIGLPMWGTLMAGGVFIDAKK